MTSSHLFVTVLVNIEFIRKCFITKISHHSVVNPVFVLSLEKLFSIQEVLFRHWMNILLCYWHVDLKMTMNRTSVFLPERKTENVQAKKARPTNPNLRSTNWRPDNYFLLSWGIGQICRCSLLLVSPRGYTPNLYGSVPTKIILLDSCVSSPPFVSGLTLLLSKQQSANTEQLEQRNGFFGYHFRTSCLWLWQRSRAHAQTLCRCLINGCERL